MWAVLGTAPGRFRGGAGRGAESHVPGASGGVAAGPASPLGPAAPLRVPRLPPAPHSRTGSMAGRGPGCSLQLPAGTQPPGGGHLYAGESEGLEEEGEVFELRPRGREKVRRSTSRDRLDGIILLTKDIQEGDTLNAIALQYCCSVSPRWPALLGACSRARCAAAERPAARGRAMCVALCISASRWAAFGEPGGCPSRRCPCLHGAGRGRDLCCGVGSQLCQLLALQLYEGQR